MKPIYGKLAYVLVQLIIVLFSVINTILGCSIIGLGGEAFVVFGLIFMFLIYALIIASFSIVVLLAIPYLLRLKHVESIKSDTSTYILIAALCSPSFLFISINTNSNGWVFTFSFILSLFCVIVNVLNIGCIARTLRS